MKFRMTLTPASGFQSGQYRMIEICSTDLENLIDPRFQKDISADTSWAEKFQKIYWQAAGHDFETGGKTLTLRIFEERYMDQFIELAEEYKDINLWSKYLSLPESVREDEKLVAAMRHLDYTVNITWVMEHYNAAAKYLNSGDDPVEATGGSHWQKYMHPKYQKRKFFPGLWSEQEKEDWGKDQPMSA